MRSKYSLQGFQGPHHCDDQPAETDAWRTGGAEVAEIGKNRCVPGLGTEKDLFLPYKEMTKKVQPGDEVLVTLHIDKSRRLCASMKKL